MIDTLDHADNASCSCSAKVDPDSPYLEDGCLLPEMFLELMAQCFAAGASCNAEARQGFLAAVNDFEIYGRAKAGALLRIGCDVLRKIGPLWLISARVEDGEARELATARFKIYVGEDE